MTLNSFQNLDIKKKINIIVFGISLIIILIIYFAALPAINDIKKLRADLITRKIELEDKLNKDKNMVDLNDRLKKIEPELLTLDKIFINKNRELDFITIIESIEKKNLVKQKLVINSVSTEDKNIIKTIPIKIDVSGQYRNILQYLSDLESLSYYININTIDIGTTEKLNPMAPGDVSYGDINLSITADTFWK